MLRVDHREQRHDENIEVGSQSAGTTWTILRVVGRVRDLWIDTEGVTP